MDLLSTISFLPEGGEVITPFLGSALAVDWLAVKFVFTDPTSWYTVKSSLVVKRGFVQVNGDIIWSTTDKWYVTNDIFCVPLPQVPPSVTDNAVLSLLSTNKGWNRWNINKGIDEPLYWMELYLL